MAAGSKSKKTYEFKDPWWSNLWEGSLPEGAIYSSEYGIESDNSPRVTTFTSYEIAADYVSDAEDLKKKYPKAFKNIVVEVNQGNNTADNMYQFDISYDDPKADSYEDHLENSKLLHKFVGMHFGLDGETFEEQVREINERYPESPPSYFSFVANKDYKQFERKERPKSKISFKRF